MTWPWTTLTVLLAATVGLMLVLAIAVWQRRRHPGAAALALFLCATSLYTITYLLDLGSPGLEAKLFWAKVRVVGTVLIPPASFALVFHAIGQSHRLTRSLFIALSIHPLITLALYWTEPAHHGIWQTVRLIAYGGYTLAEFTYGPAYWLHISYIYLLSCFILVQTAGALSKMPNVSRGQTVALFLSVLSPVIGSLLATLGLNPIAPFRLEPFMFPVAAAGWGWAIFRYQLFGVVPIARDRVVETLEDVVIVLDARQRVGDLNRAARRLLGNADPVGQLASQAFAQYPRLIPFLTQPIVSPITLVVEGAQRHYDLRTITVYDQRERTRGWLTTLRDVTQRERAARIQSATYQISQAAAQTENLPELYQSIHATLGTLMPAQNLFIALYDAAAGQLSFPYYVDEHDPPPPPQKLGRGLTEYVIRSCKTQWVHPEAFERLVTAGEVEEIGAPSIDWLGAPLITQTRIIGVLAVQSYTPGVQFSEAERDILTFVSNQISLAIERKQAEADLRTRDRMLAGVAEATADLLSPDLLSDTIQRALARLGNATDVDRAYIFENGRDPLTAEPVMSQRYEWARPEISPQIDNPELQNLPYARFPTWWERLSAGQAIGSLVRDLPPDLQGMMERQGILSLLLVPILVENRFWGFIGLDECHSYRLWSASEIALLVTAAANFGTAILRRQTELVLQDNERNLGLLNAITQSALQTPHPEAMFSTLARQLTELFHARGCYIGLWEEAPPRLLSVAAFGPQAQEFLALPAEPAYTRFAEQVLEQRQPIVTAARPAPGAPVVPAYLEAMFHEWDFVLLPLIADEARLGIIGLAFDSPHAFTPDEIARGTQAAGQVALTLAKVRALELAERHAQEAETLRQAGAAVAATLDQDEAVQRILEQLARVVPYDTASVQLLREGNLEVVGGRGWADLNMVLGLRFPVPGDHVTTLVVDQRQPVLIADAWQEAPYFRDRPHTQHVRAWLGVPLIIQQRLTGIISLHSRQPGYFTADHARLSSAFADQVAVAIENARLYQSAQQNASEIATLYRASEQLFGSSQDVTELTHRIVQAVAREFPDIYCGLRLMDESENYLGGLAEAGALLSTTHPRPALELNEPGLIPLAVRTGEAVYAPDVRADARYVFSHQDTLAELVVPLLVKGRVIGVLNLESPQANGFDERARRLIVAFAERAALALENAQLLARLEVARQAAQEASRLKGEFLTNTSHELRTPLTGILGSLDLVIDGLCQSPEEEREFLRIARQAGRQLLGMINMLLDLSRIESGKIEVKAQTVDVSPLLIEVFLLMQPQAQERSLQLELKLPPEPHSRIWADPDKVRQIMLNLIGNALKFTMRGQVVVSAEPDQAEGLMRLNVQDTGIGIPQEQQGRLFQPFVQLDGSSTRKFGGTGLGLNISRRLAQMMDGSLTLYSDGADRGSTFTLILPLAQQA